MLTSQTAKVFQIMLGADLIPLEPYPGPHGPWRCLHTVCGREVTPQYNSIQQGGGGCKYCSGRFPIMERIMAVMEAAGLTPLEPYPGNKKPWRCRHTCGREVTPRYNSIQSGFGKGCKYCAGNLPDMSKVRETMKAAGLTPLEPYPGNNKPWRSRHVCGREVSPRYNGIRQGQGGCQYCAGKIPNMAEIMVFMSQAGLTPLEPYPGNKKPWRCLHTCGHEVSPKWNTIQQGGKGCKHCAKQCSTTCECRKAA